MAIKRKQFGLAESPVPSGEPNIPVRCQDDDGAKTNVCSDEWRPTSRRLEEEPGSQPKEVDVPRVRRCGHRNE